jgi:SAM-dependent methyltransferase
VVRTENAPCILPAARKYWSDLAARNGAFAATRKLIAALCEFLLDSSPARLKRRFGDADYDWDYRVNTTSGAVGWRDRLLGVFHSPYQPTEPALFQEMIGELQECTKLNLNEFTFIDLGSGKGRTLLMASDFPFRRIFGVELLPSLHAIAQQNLARYKSDSQKCFALESVCTDATTFSFPDGPLLIYLFNPFPEPGLRRTLANLEATLHSRPRPVYVLYHNPQLEQVVAECGFLGKIAGTHQYSIFAARF